MSMKEKYGALWCDIEEDAQGQIIKENYNEEKDILSVLLLRNDGLYQPYYYQKIKDPHLSLPVWSASNEKVLFSTEIEAVEYIQSLINKNV